MNFVVGGAFYWLSNQQILVVMFRTGQAVGVAVCNFDRKCFAYTDDFNFEIQGFASEGMIRIDVDLLTFDFCNPQWNWLTAGTFRHEVHSNFEFNARLEVLARNWHGAFAFSQAVTLFRSNFDRQLFADRFAGKLVFQARNNIVRAMKVRHRLAADGGVEFFAFAVTKGVMNDNYFVISDDLVVGHNKISVFGCP